MSIKCLQCGGETRARRGKFKDKSLGLPDLTLIGVEIRKCKKCGEEEVVIPKAEQLRKLIVSKLVKKSGLLIGAEVRYLRKYIGWSGVQFAEKFKVAPETISRWENDKEKIGYAEDGLLRVFAQCHAPITSYEIEDLISAIQSHDQKRKVLPITAKQEDHEWIMSGAR